MGTFTLLEHGAPTLMRLPMDPLGKTGTPRNPYWDLKAPNFSVLRFRRCVFPRCPKSGVAFAPNFAARKARRRTRNKEGWRGGLFWLRFLRVSDSNVPRAFQTKEHD
jgi:hypothetical protein